MAIKQWEGELMKSRKSLNLFFSCAVVLSVISFAGCGGPKLDSKWRDAEVTIDGVNDEWQGAMNYIEKANAAVGFLNDFEFRLNRVYTEDKDIS